MREENCIFCRIAAGEIPSATLYEDEDFRVILDISGEEKQKLTVPDLLARFTKASGEEIENDRLLLA